MAAKAVICEVVGSLYGHSRLLKSALNSFPRRSYCRKLSSQVTTRSEDGADEADGPKFGLFFDIDGVIVRGRTLLPSAKEAFKMLTDKHGKFWVPTIFVTNAGNTLRQTKSDQLSKWLGVDVDPEQVLMSHSPLKMFRQFLDKHVLVTGQGPVEEIARHLGFTRVTTMERMRHCFPALDMVDHKRRKTAPCAFEKYFPRIEAVILFGEPVRWETNLQILLDVLVTNGKPSDAPSDIPYPHIPVLACNMDLLWMSEAPMPRFAHGSFLHCLESLYKKVAGQDLKYTALVGKPSEITYHHAEHVLQLQARNMGLAGIKTMYCIGDNPDVDIYGANLYCRYLNKKFTKISKQKKKRSTSYGDYDPGHYLPDDEMPLGAAAADTNGDSDPLGCEACESILVCTGVFCHTRDYSKTENILLDHNHRDFIMDPELKKPNLITHNVLEAVQAIFDKEGIS